MAGCYRAARWAKRRFFDRAELNAWQREYEFYAEFVEPGELVFDVGANYGGKAEIFLALGATVVAFEPQPECMAELLARLGKPQCLKPVSSALGSEVGRAPMFVHRHRTCSSLLPQWLGASELTINVPVTTLDNAIREFGLPHFVKIDVEGFEFEVLKGLSRSVPVVSFECHNTVDGIDRALACVRKLQDLSNIELNMTGQENATFLLTDWRVPTQFERWMKDDLPQRKEIHYGDVFARAMAAYN